MSPAEPKPVEGSPEFVRAVQLQQVYWTYRADEQSQLRQQGLDQLSWPKRLRLHHLNCLQHVGDPSSSLAEQACLETYRRLSAPDSPYRPRGAMVWQGELAQPGGNRPADFQGHIVNASLTHLGCLEIYRLDASNQPVSIEFVAFDELSAILFAPPKLIRATKLFFDDGHDETVFIPVLYGLTWTLGNDSARQGKTTEFVAHVDSAELRTAGVSGLGIGHQDFMIDDYNGRANLFGLGSVAEIAFPLDTGDPRFDEKARLRGIDPTEVRKQVGQI